MLSYHPYVYLYLYSRDIHDSLPVPSIADQDINWGFMLLLDLLEHVGDLFHGPYIDLMNRYPQVLA